MVGNMITVDVIADLDILDAIQDEARKSPGKMKTAYRRAVGRLRGRILSRLKVTTPKPSYPLRWTSEKQRRAFFATGGFGNGIPYQRTGKLQDSYDVVLTDGTNDGGILSVTNSDPKAQFVVGDRVQPMFLDIGWVQISDVVSDARVEAEEVLIDTWFLIADPFAGVPQ